MSTLIILAAAGVINMEARIIQVRTTAHDVLIDCETLESPECQEAYEKYLECEKDGTLEEDCYLD